MAVFSSNLEELQDLLVTLASLEKDVVFAGRVASETLSSGGTIFFCGNGGSAADSQHLAAELTGRFVHERRALSAISLSTDTSALTCIGNDYSFDQIFARQISAIGREGDLLFAISTSGNSNNVIQAVHTAKEKGIFTVGLLGRDGGALVEHCDHAIVVPSDTTARIQECHILIGHSVCGIIEENLELNNH